VKFEVLREDGKKTETLTVKLAAMPGAADVKQPDEVPPAKALPVAASKKKALEPLEVSNPKIKQPKVEPPKKAETGFLKRGEGKDAKDWKYWVYVHEDYDPNIAHALVVWLHPPGKNSEDDAKDFADLWEDYCKDHNIILVGPRSENEAGWIPSEAE